MPTSAFILQTYYNKVIRRFCWSTVQIQQSPLQHWIRMLSQNLPSADSSHSISRSWIYLSEEPFSEIKKVNSLFWYLFLMTGLYYDISILMTCLIMTCLYFDDVFIVTGLIFDNTSLLWQVFYDRSLWWQVFMTSLYYDISL